jgi:pimeloyl-ACP methyl ester carboxylesterase
MALRARWATRQKSDHCHGARFFRGERDVSRPLCRCVRSCGLASVVFDNRNFGASDGEPRQDIDPWRQVRDYRDAISYVETLGETDPDRIGVWGSSYSRGHVLVVGAIDRRVKCVVSQVPLVSGHGNARRLIRADYLAGMQKMFSEDRRARMAGKPPAMIPVVAQDPSAPSALPTPDSWAWFTETGRTLAPPWKRSHPALGRNVHGVRAGQLRELRQPNAAADDSCARRRTDRRRSGT